MIFVAILQSIFVLSAFGENCENVLCSNVLDYVCGMTESGDGTKIFKRYQNVCYLRKAQCQLNSIEEIRQVPDRLCNIKKRRVHNSNGRRVYDFSIVGAHQACNHTCPTYCTDTYEPACAQIWKPNMKSYNYRPMINHCHIDLFSCAVGVHVTLQPLGKCYKNPSGLLFMSQVAAMKSLKLLDETPRELNYAKFPKPITSMSRRSYDENFTKEQLIDFVRRIIPSK